MSLIWSDAVSVIALLSAMAAVWVVLGRLALDLLTGKVVQRYDTLDNHDPATAVDWSRKSLRRPKRAA